jgi:hypothetical protein
MNNGNEKFIACGMYAFNDDLVGAWQQLFTSFFELLDAGSKQAIELCFDSDQSLLRNPGLFFGHTCGYPLMKHLKGQVTPFCVPAEDALSRKLAPCAGPRSWAGPRSRGRLLSGYLHSWRKKRNQKNSTHYPRAGHRHTNSRRHEAREFVRVATTIPSTLDFSEFETLIDNLGHYWLAWNQNPWR